MKNKEQTLSQKLKRISDELANTIYPTTMRFPKIEQFALADQIRRSSLSVPSNIYEGLARETSREKKRFLNIAYGSLAELKYQIYFARKQQYLNLAEYSKISSIMEELSKLLYSLIKKLRSNSN